MERQAVNVTPDRSRANQPDVPGRLVLDWIATHLAAPDQGEPFVLYPWQADLVLKSYELPVNRRVIPPGWSVRNR